MAVIEHDIKKKGARVISAAGEGTESDGPTDVLMRRIVERPPNMRDCSSASGPGRPSRRRRPGEKTGGEVPDGFRVEVSKLVPDRAEQEVIGLIKELKATGLSFEGIAEELGRRGIPRRAGGPWTWGS